MKSPISKFVIGILVVAAAACGGSSNNASSQPDVVIGLSTPLSPPGNVAQGILNQRGAELGIQYVNTVMGGVLGGRKVQLSVCDDTGQAAAGVACYRRLVTEDKAVVVTGTIHSSVCLAQNEVAKDIGVPTITSNCSATNVTSTMYATSFRTHTLDIFKTDLALKFMQQKGFKTVAIVAEQTDYGTGVINAYKSESTALNIPVDLKVTTFDINAADITPQLLKVKAANPDIIVDGGVGRTADLVIDNASTIGLFPQKPMLINYDLPTQPNYWQLHAKDGAGLYFLEYYSPSEPLSAASKWMTDKYRTAYNDTPTYNSLNTFGDIVVIAEGLNLANSTDPKKLIAALEKGSFNGWTTTPVTFPKKSGVFWHEWYAPIQLAQITALNQPWQQAPVVMTG